MKALLVSALLVLTLAAGSSGQVALDPTKTDSTSGYYLRLVQPLYHMSDTIPWANPQPSLYDRIARLEQLVDSLRDEISRMHPLSGEVQWWTLPYRIDSLNMLRK